MEAVVEDSTEALPSKSTCLHSVCPAETLIHTPMNDSLQSPRNQPTAFFTLVNVSFQCWFDLLFYILWVIILTPCSKVLLINWESFSPCSCWWCLFSAGLSGTVEPLADVILLRGMADRGCQSRQLTANLDIEDFSCKWQRCYYIYSDLMYRFKETEMWLKFFF